MDDQYATEMSNLFTTVRVYIRVLSTAAHADPTQTFKARLVEVIDQAQHFAALGPSSGAGASGDMTAMFREGLDATERECEWCNPDVACDADNPMCPVFALAQASAKQTKKWYETSDRGRR